MSVIIIIGGDKARAAVKNLETASLTMTDRERTLSELVLKFLADYSDTLIGDKKLA